MYEAIGIIGIIVVCWLGWSIHKATLRVNSLRSDDREWGKEAQFIAVNELQVPADYYTKILLNRMNQIQESADLLGKPGGPHCNDNRPRRLAYAIYYEYKGEQEQARLEDPLP